MRFPPAVLDEIRARLPVSQVVSRHVRLKRAGREFIGLSPFKQEKTPSFTVNDEKGFFHCFASGEHGDIFSFLTKVEGVSFPEAVEKLAQEAGVELPKETGEQRQVADRLARLREVVEASCRFFEQAMSAPAADHARAYLERRRLDEAAISAFRIGYAPAGRDSLKRTLLTLGFSIEEIIASGMCIGGADIAVPYDRFRDRIMFPITDLKGRIVAFGGRALAADQKAKYLNSPETPLFHKGHLLYNVAAARKTAFDCGQLIAVEGYMDVIACAAAGFKNAVAPLGTALTREQLQLMWRLAREPVLCFDGDEAGRKAAWRAIDTALPHLAPGLSLRFAFLPDGQDPDDVVRNEGAAAFKVVIERAAPLVDMLWRRELDKAPVDTPERRADLEKRLFDEIGRIENAAVRGHYEKDLRGRLWEQWRGAKNVVRMASPGEAWRSRRGDVRSAGMSVPRSSLRDCALIRSTRGGASPREIVMLQAMLTHPWLLDDYSEEMAEFVFSRRDLAELRDAILAFAIRRVGENGLDSEELRVHLKENGLGETLAKLDSDVFGGERWARNEALPRDTVVESWQQMLGIHRRNKTVQTELVGAERAYCEEASEENFVKVRDLNAHYHYSDVTQAGGQDADEAEPFNEFVDRVLRRSEPPASGS